MSTNGMLVDLRDASGQPRLPFTLLSLNVLCYLLTSVLTTSSRRLLCPHMDDADHGRDVDPCPLTTG